MTERFSIVGYARISVDDELDRDNVSIENQKAIIQDFVAHKFPASTLEFYEDRDRSGYTFEQREGYQAMRRGLMAHQYDILIVKDFSRFSRRNSRGLVELEDLRDAGVRIISIGDNIDFPNDDDWLKIQFQFLINEMPVTDTSKKVRSVVRRRQQDGQWLCAAPYGYLLNKQKQFEVVPTEAEIVRQIFTLYNDGWGYKKIANYLTDQGVPTPRMSEQMRREAAGEDCRRSVKQAWAIVTIQGILDNDFYIGTLRQGKYTRAKINGKDVKRDVLEQVVLENHHQPIVDYRTFATTRALREQRTRSHYRGQKKNDNVYSGFLVCGDCGSPMFAMSRSDLKPAYTCGTYHRRGRAGCTSHHIRVDKLDELMKTYLQRVKERSAAMLEQLNADLNRETEDVAETERSAAHLADILDQLQEELKATKRQRVRDLMRHPEQEELLEETYDELESDLLHRIEGIQNQLQMAADKRNTILQVNRVAKTALEVFEDVLQKDHLDRQDLHLLLEQIKVYEDHLEIQLKADIDHLLRCGGLPQGQEDAVAALAPTGEDPVNFKDGVEPHTSVTLVQTSSRRPNKVFHANVISDGDPLEIYTDKDGEVIFKKYSLMGGIGDFAGQICEALNKTTGHTAIVTDRDSCLAAAGSGRRELSDKRISAALEQILDDRSIYQHTAGQTPLLVCEENSRYFVSCAAPILSEGDVLGCVLFAGGEEELSTGETEYKILQTISGFLGRHMES
ncbi:MAG TPA: recombinase family protein [Candidatus Flavonifractor merdigallinarum]|uniref:Recombinase family protein n=1 Tax=Candidatus Flavonifractor merdigallinarum TaxID=2838589 RepID=A0A9D2BYG8_9FIRM|nr:recombinase family protein [Candidatus Flavonifractor merdigallinarum]